MTTKKQQMFEVLHNRKDTPTYEQLRREFGNTCNISRIINIVSELNSTDGILIKKGREKGFSTVKMIVDENYKPAVSRKDLYNKMSGIYTHLTMVDIMELFPEKQKLSRCITTSLIAQLRVAGVVFDVKKVKNRNAYKIASERNLDSFGKKAKPKKVEVDPKVLKPSFVQHLFSNNADKALAEHRIMVANML